jgi:hypothetical protein
MEGEGTQRGSYATIGLDQLSVRPETTRIFIQEWESCRGSGNTGNRTAAAQIFLPHDEARKLRDCLNALYPD